MPFLKLVTKITAFHNIKNTDDAEKTETTDNTENTESEEVIVQPREILFTFTAEFGSIPMDREDDYFEPNLSNFAKGFPLKNTMIIPRPCAFKSYNLKPVSYYRG